MLFESKDFYGYKNTIPSKVKSAEEFILLFTTSNRIVTVEIPSKNTEISIG